MGRAKYAQGKKVRVQDAPITGRAKYAQGKQIRVEDAQGPLRAQMAARCFEMRHRFRHGLPWEMYGDSCYCMG